MLGKLTLTRRWEDASRFDPQAHLDDVVRYAFFRLGSREDAEDVAAQVLHEASRAGRADDPRLYMIGIARRKVADALRKRRRSRSLDEPGFVPPSVDGDMEAAQRRLMVADVMRTLDDDQREVLALKYLVGLSAKEIAGLMDRTPAAVNSLLQRAREAFAQAAGDRFTEE